MFEPEAVLSAEREEGPPGPGSRVRRWFRRRILAPLRDQLTRGATPEAVALSLGLGAALGLFPILGTTTVLCLVAGVALRLNHPALQIANYLVAFLQLPLLYVFVRLGERLLGAGPASFSIPALIAEFQGDPWAFVARWGVTGLHGVFGWALAAPFLVGSLYTLLVPVVRSLSRRLPAAAPPPAAA
jgi:uncharacterized protein (DUF2062 family)